MEDNCICYYRFKAFGLSVRMVFKWAKRRFIIACLAFPFINANGQLLVPLSDEMNFRVEERLSLSETMSFTVWKPYYYAQISSKSDSLSSEALNNLLGGLYIVTGAETNNLSKKSLLRRKILEESFIEVDSSNFYIYADPLFNFGAGKDNTGRRTLYNSRGFRAGGQLGRSFAFHTEFYENQAIFPKWIDEPLRKYKVIPGQGMGRVNVNTWDYAHAEGYLSFSPTEKLNLQFGQGKQFIGEGYRSLLLSDVAYSYPYFRATWLTKNFMYSWMLASMQNIGLYVNVLDDEEAYKRETASVHLLSVNMGKRVQFSLIQCQLFNLPDTFGKMKANARLFNPVMLPLADSKDVRALWGVNLKVKISQNFWFYNQWMFDNLLSDAKTKSAVQAGFKYFRVAGIPGLYLQGEYNRIAAGAYQSNERPLQWMQYGEPLAYGYGNNVSEINGTIQYNFHRWQFTDRLIYAKTAETTTQSASVIKPGIPNFVVGQKLLQNTTELNFYLNPKTLMHFSLGFTYRKETITAENTGSWVHFAFRTGLMNRSEGR